MDNGDVYRQQLSAMDNGDVYRQQLSAMDNGDVYRQQISAKEMGGLHLCRFGLFERPKGGHESFARL